MLMLIHIERYFTKQGWSLEKAPIAWTRNGRAFIIRDNDKLVSDWLPMFFQKGKFSSFKRKLYRWGFRQVQLHNHHGGDLLSATAIAAGNSRELVFGNEHFQRDQKVLLPRMKSITAESLRRQQAAAQKEMRKEAGASDVKAAPEQAHHQPVNAALAHQNSHNGGVLQTLTALLSLGGPPPPLPLPQQHQASCPTAGEIALFTALVQGGAKSSQQPSVATAAACQAQQSLGSLLQGADSSTLQQILHNLQAEQQRRQQQEELVKNIHRMMFPSHAQQQQQQPAAPALASPLDATSNNQQSMLARLILQHLGDLGGAAAANNGL
jgi:HSF-type DNA-binding